MLRIGWRRIGLLVAAFAAGVVLTTGSSEASSGSRLATGPESTSSGVLAGLEGGIAERPVVKAGEVFFTATLKHVDYEGGPVILSGSEDGTGRFVVDDVVKVRVVHPDKTVATYYHDFSHGCTAGSDTGPKNIASKFAIGRNDVTLVLKDKCGSVESASPIWLSP